MDLKMIAWGMVIILALLFVLTPKFRKKEQTSNKLEVIFFEALKTYKSLPSEDNKSKLEAALSSYYKNMDLSEDELEKKRSEIFNG